MESFPTPCDKKSCRKKQADPYKWKRNEAKKSGGLCESNLIGRYILKRSKRPGNVMIEGHLYYKIDDGVLKNVCQRNKTTSMINPRQINASNNITDSKKKDLLTLLRSHWGDDWQQNGDLSFFVALLESNNQDEDDENEDRECDLECEENHEVDDLHV